MVGTDTMEEMRVPVLIDVLTYEEQEERRELVEMKRDFDL
jgi:hypothetical protein